MTQRGANVKPPVAQRRAAARTAWIVGGIAVAVYAAFILSGVLAQ